LEVHIKALGDHTSALLRHVRSNPLVSPSLRVDGPYGRLSFDYRRYESLVFIGAGIGATPLVSIIKEIFQVGVPELQRTPYPLSPYIRNVYLVWIVPSSQAWSWFFDPILQALQVAAQPGMPSLRIEGYVTQPDPGFDKLKKFIKHKTTRFHVSTGRPNLASVMTRVEQCIGPGKKRIGALTCGPKRLTNAVWDECNRRSGEETSYDCHREVFEF
jgi:ferredoxin-NADP reductase